MLPFGLVIDVARLVVDVVVVDLAELNSRGLSIYRGNAAQISVELRAKLELNAQMSVANVWHVMIYL